MIGQPYRVSYARSTSSGSAAPPDTRIRSSDRSDTPGWSSSAMYIAGTPWNTVTPSRRMTSSARPASNRGIRVSRPPAWIVALSAQVWPNAWYSGSAPRTTSSTPSASIRATVSALLPRFAWVSSMPFGRPVVPALYRMTAVSSAVLGTGSPGGIVRSSRRNSPGTTNMKSVRVPAVPASTVSAYACQAITSRAAQSSTYAAISRRFSSGSSGTTTAPARRTP